MSWAIRGVDLRIEHGERVLLLGPSGGGKSSLLVAIAGLHERSTGALEEGELLVEGRPARGTSAVGIVFQDPESQIVMGRAGDDVAFGLEERCVPPTEIWPRVDRALRDVGFGYGRDRRTEALSGGEKQRLAIASVLALEPRVLLLDEPTADLDPEGRRLLHGLIARLPRDLTIVIVEHRVAEALPLVDRVIAIDGARGVTADGPRDEVMRDRRDDLVRSGVWVPDAPVPRSRGRASGRALVEARDASLRYPLSDRATSPATAEAREGEVLAVTGPNGSGKTSLLLLLGGLVAPAAGTVRADALDAARPEPWRWRARSLPPRIGSVFQDPDHQFLERRAIDEVLLGPSVTGSDPRRADALMARLGLEALRDANPYTLSGGEKRRLGVAAVLACSPRALLLDEPSYGQDHRTFADLIGLIAEERDRGVAIALSTHDALLVDALADRVHELARS